MLKFPVAGGTVTLRSSKIIPLECTMVLGPGKGGQAPERNKAIYEEVERLVDAGIMKEVHYHSWLSNPVMVRKHDDSWRMCVDFKDLNKVRPKDGYQLPEIDWKVESLCRYPFKCFLEVAQTITHNAAFQTDNLDAYDLDCDDISSAKAVLIDNLLSCDSEVLYEVPHSDSYHTDMMNQSVQEMQYSEQSPIDDYPDNEITSESNIAPYS
ncbi:hypothetical protein Tco_0919233 [Tanacetum coccineum]